MKLRLTLGILSVLALAGCGEPAPQMEQAPPKEQKVVMVPAVGGGAQQNQNGAQPGVNNNASAPNSTPDTVKQPGDK